MKKILTVSLFAMMAVSAANADIASVDYVNDRTGNLRFSDTGITKDAKTLTEAVVALDNQFTVTDGGVGTLTTTVDGLVADVETIQGQLSASGTTGKAITAAQAAADAAQAAADAAQQTADGKQAKSTADYQMGNKDGSWTAMTTAQQNALNSGVTSTTVAQVATNATDIAALETALGTTGDTGKAITAAQAAADAAQDAADAAQQTADAAQAAADAAQQTADGKQAKSTADYQMGNKDGSWTAMTTAQQNALNSGVTSTTVAQVATNQTNIAANAADIAALETALGTTGDTGKAITAAQDAADAAQDAADAAQAAADAAQQTADGKQAKSTADYQMGNKDGSWTAMTTAQQNALNSGVTSTTVAQVATNKTDIATVKTNLGPLNVDIPDACATGTCSLVMKEGVVAWEVVSY